MAWMRSLIITAAVTICGLTGALCADTANAMTLAPITVRSYLGQILIAEIDILNLSSQEAPSLQVAIASPTVFADLKMDYSQAIGDAQIELLQRPIGSRYIQLRSTRPMVEPLVDLVIEVSSSASKFVRPYRLLLDPAPLNEARLAVSTSAPHSAETSFPAGIVNSPLALRPLGPANGEQSTGPEMSNQAKFRQTPQPLKPANTASTPSAAVSKSTPPSKASAVDALVHESNLTKFVRPVYPAAAASVATMPGVAQTAIPELAQVPATPSFGPSSSRAMPDLIAMALETLAKPFRVFFFGLVLIGTVIGYLLWTRSPNNDSPTPPPGTAADQTHAYWMAPGEQTHHPIGGNPVDPTLWNSSKRAKNEGYAAELDPLAQADVFLADDKNGLAEEILRRKFENAILPSNTTASGLPGRPDGTVAGWDPVLSLMLGEAPAATGTTTELPSTAPLFFDLDAPPMNLAASPSAQGQGNSEQLETSMELAQKFIDIGDLQSAHRLLDDVLANGSDLQRNRARAMMAGPK